MVKIGEEQCVLNKLNAYHPKIQFTKEVEERGSISFLDVAIKRNETDGTMETAVYRKPTNTDIYIHWKAHAPSSWKIATLKNLVQRAILVSSTKHALEEELHHLKRVFCSVNDYPEQLVEEVIKNEQNRKEPPEAIAATTNHNEDEIQLQLTLPYAGKVGEKIVEKIQKYVKRTASNKDRKVKVTSIYTSKKLSSRLSLKDKTKPEHLHNLVYYVPCPNKRCKSAYCGETKRRMEKRTGEHRSTDPNSHVLRHSKRTKHKRVQNGDFKILRQGFKSNFRRKISESLFIKQYKPDLDVQKESYKLSLFN